MSGAVYRFTGKYVSAPLSPVDIGLFTVDIDATGQAHGDAYSLVYDELHAVSGTLVGTTLNGSTSGGATFTGTLDVNAGVMNGSYTNLSNGNFGSFEGTGCKLN